MTDNGSNHDNNDDDDYHVEDYSANSPSPLCYYRDKSAFFPTDVGHGHRLTFGNGMWAEAAECLLKKYVTCLPASYAPVLQQGPECRLSRAPS